MKVFFNFKNFLTNNFSQFGTNHNFKSMCCPKTIDSGIIQNPRIIFSLLYRLFNLLDLCFAGYSYFLSIYNTTKQPTFVSCFSTREKKEQKRSEGYQKQQKCNIEIIPTFHWRSRYHLNIYVTYRRMLCFQRLFECFIVRGPMPRVPYHRGYVSQHCVLCSSLRVRDRVSQSYHSDGLFLHEELLEKSTSLQNFIMIFQLVQ